MKSLRRKLFNLVAGVSLLCCAAAVVLWGRSYLASDTLFFYELWDDGSWAQWRQHNFKSGAGGIGYNQVTQAQAREVTWEPFISEQGVPLWKVSSGPTTYPDFNFRTNDEPTLGFKFGRFVNQARPWSLTYPNARGMRPPSSGYQAVFPYWALVLTFAMLPAIWYWQWHLRRTTLREGRCLNCGYDLRATPQRCPECGTIAVPKT